MDYSINFSYEDNKQLKEIYKELLKKNGLTMLEASKLLGLSTPQQLNNKFNNKMFVMEQKGYKIIQKNVKIKKTMDSYALCGKITYNKPIGKVSYIDVKKIEEETVSINERN